MAGIKRANTSGLTKPGTAIPDVPDAPTVGAATNVGTSRAYNDGAATVAYTEAATGGAVTTYTATSTPGSFTGTGASPITVAGLASGTSYTFAVTGTNSTGTSPASAASSSITATTVPQAPSITSVSSPSAGKAIVNFTAGATGGSTITSYRITATGGANPVISNATSGTQFNITAGTYTFTVAAENANGFSAESSASGSLVVAAPVYTLQQTFNSSGNFTVPSGKTELAVYVVAGGTSGGRGGNAVAFSDYTVTSGDVFSVTVGSSGGTSSFGNIATAPASNSASSNLPGGNYVTRNGGSWPSGSKSGNLVPPGGYAELPNTSFGGAGGRGGCAGNVYGNNIGGLGPAGPNPATAGGSDFGGSGGAGGRNGRDNCGGTVSYAGSPGGAGNGIGGGGGTGGYNPSALGGGQQPSGAGAAGRVIVYVR